MRVVGLDIHRVSAEAVMLDDGRVARLGRVGMTREHLEAFARRLTRDGHVVVEATGNATAVAGVIGPHVGRVAIADPRQVRLIAEARVKTDVVDATVPARLHASGFLPGLWVPDQRTLALRRQVTRRNQIVRQRARLRTIIQPILHAHLVPPCPHAELLGPKGRAWLRGQVLPPDEQDAVARHLREHDRLSEDLRAVEREIARDALADADTKRLMAVPVESPRQEGAHERRKGGATMGSAAGPPPPGPALRRAVTRGPAEHSARPTRKSCSTSSVVQGW